MSGIEQIAGKEPPAADPSAVEERLAAILDHAADAIIVVDERGVVENSNLAATRLFGWDEGELRGQRLEVLMGAADQAAHAGHLAHYLSTGRSGILNVGPRRLEARRRDGTPVPIELSVGEAWVGGQRKFIGACRDISQRLASEAALEQERRQSEAWARAAEAARAEAEAANLAKSRFLATMSHEIRTPLNGVIAIADVLGGRVTVAEDRDLVGIIRESGRTLLALLNEILDLSKIEAGAFTLAAAPFSLSDLIGSLAVTWRCAASAKGLGLEASAAGLPPVVGDEGRLRQVISNLLSNAIKFTDRGSVSIRCECEGVEDGKARLTLVVADTGQGFDAALAEKVFEPFVQADSTNTRRHGGTGLGLAICRDFIRLMGGEIHAESAPNLGTRMIVRLALPLAQRRADEVQPAWRAAPQIEADAVAPRVLVAEDHPLNRRIMAVLLDEMGIAHEMVEDGAAAVRAVAEGRYDLVLMDVQMPVMDGLEATRAIRRLPGAAGRTPVIAVTADAMSDHAANCSAAGMDGFLAKPIQPKALQQLLLEQFAEQAHRLAS